MNRTFALAIGLLLAALSACTTAGPTPVPTQATPTSAPATQAATVPGADTPIDLKSIPITPEVSARAAAIFHDGQAKGRNIHAFSKIGDCMTANETYLVPFSAGGYQLGAYGYLKDTIENYRGVTLREIDGKKVDSFSNPGLATAPGFTSASPLDPIWANTNWCKSGESPLACEYRISNPAVALIMFGTNDAAYVDADKFESYLRAIVKETVEAGIVPVVSTFPPRPDQPEKSLSYNQIVVRIAREYDVPLVNLWLALQDKDGLGVNPEHVNQLTLPADGCPICFEPEDLKAGANTHNLVTLLALNALLAKLRP